MVLTPSQKYILIQFLTSIDTLILSKPINTRLTDVFKNFIKINEEDYKRISEIPELTNLIQEFLDYKKQYWLPDGENGYKIIANNKVCDNISKIILDIALLYKDVM